MSTNLIQDMNHMHAHYNVHEAIRKLDRDKLAIFLKFRIDFLQEELNEMIDAYVSHESGKISGEEAADDTVDALIDLIVIAVGTLDLFNVDAYKAWDEVYKANMNKQIGIKESRPNPFGLPDLVKPEGWVAPSHKDNVGLLSEVFK